MRLSSINLKAKENIAKSKKQAFGSAFFGLWSKVLILFWFLKFEGYSYQYINAIIFMQFISKPAINGALG